MTTVEPGDRYLTGDYEQANPGWHAEDAVHKARAVVRFVSDLRLAPASVVDVGCGTGGVAAYLADAWPMVTVSAWDIAPRAIEQARERGSRAAFRLGDAAAKGVRADLALCLDVVEHVVDDIAFLRGLSRVAPACVLRIPLDLSVLDLLRPQRMLDARRRYGHLHAYTRASAIALVEEAGLSVEAVRFDRVPPHLGTTRQRLVDVVRRTGFRASPERTADVLGGWSLLVHARSVSGTETPPASPAGAPGSR